MAKSNLTRRRAPRNDLTVDFVRAILHYDPLTGAFTWKNRNDLPPICWRKTGKPAGTGTDKDGYPCVQIRKKRYPCHRIAWVIMTGEWPSVDIDHRNGIRADNRWENLRAATRRQNLGNMKLRPTNKSGFKGVSWHRPTKKWVAQIRDGGRQRYLGVFHTPEEAHQAYCKAAEVIFGEFARFA